MRFSDVCRSVKNPLVGIRDVTPIFSMSLGGIRGQISVNWCYLLTKWERKRLNSSFVSQSLDYWLCIFSDTRWRPRILSEICDMGVNNLYTPLTHPSRETLPSSNTPVTLQVEIYYSCGIFYHLWFREDQSPIGPNGLFSNSFKLETSQLRGITTFWYGWRSSDLVRTCNNCVSFQTLDLLQISELLLTRWHYWSRAHTGGVPYCQSFVFLLVGL